jgi:GT2 family glycosyltransferase
MEIIVVDNDSRDATREAVSGAQKIAPCEVRYVLESRIGVSCARNRGIGEARGTFVAFIDDDARAEPGWAEELLQCLHRTGAAGAGGKVIAEVKGDVPRWLPERVRQRVMPSYDLGDRLLGIDASGARPMPWGSNLALRKSVLQRFGGFREDLGIFGTIVKPGEDTELCLRLLRARESIVYCPRAVVRHMCPSVKLSFPALLAWAYRRGLSRTRTSRGERPVWRELCSVGVASLRSLRGVARAMIAGRRDDLLLHGLDAITFLGCLREHFPRVVASPACGADRWTGKPLPADGCEVSVVVCTRDRPGLLGRLLESLSGCRPLPDEVVVVDQSMARDSESVVLRHAASLPRTVYIHLASKGLSRARNAGLSRASADIVAFTDDDCIVTRDWVRQIRSCFSEGTELACVMGRVLPAGESQQRFPLSTRTSPQRKVYGRPQGCDPAELGWGGNFSFRVTALRCAGPFDTSLGPGSRWPAAEDTDMVYRLLKARRQVLYAPNVTVYHAHERTWDELMRCRVGYRAGKVAFLVKHILRGDLWLLKRLRWEVTGCLRALLSADGGTGTTATWAHRLALFSATVSPVLSRPVYEIARPLLTPKDGARVSRYWTKPGVSQGVSS